MENDPLLDTPQMAALLGVKPATLEVWRSTGRYNLRFVKVGRAVRYRRSEGLRFVAEHTLTKTRGSA